MATNAFELLHEICAELSEIRSDHEALQGRVERMLRSGTVTDVDASKQMYRQVIGLDDDGQDVKGPWVPYAQTAGDRKIHAPVSVGQQMMLFSPDGDHEQGHGIPLTFSDQIPSPSQDAKTHVDQLGMTKNTITDGTWLQETNGASVMMSDGMIVLTVGGSTITMNSGKVVITAADIALVGNVSLGAEGATRALSLMGSVDSAGHKEVSNLATKVTGV